MMRAPMHRWRRAEISQKAEAGAAFSPV